MLVVIDTDERGREEMWSALKDTADQKRKDGLIAAADVCDDICAQIYKERCAGALLVLERY